MVIKKIGKKLFKGQNVMNISLPVYIFDKRTMLQVFAYELKESSLYYQKHIMLKIKLKN